MIEKIKNLGNLPLIIILIVVVILAIVLSVIKAQTTKNTNADTNIGTNTNISDITNEDENKEDEEKQEEIIPEVNIQEIEEEEENDTEEEPTVDSKYFIRVNYGQNVVTIYTKDSNGKYTVPYKAMVCSTGTATPRSGTYAIPTGTYARGTWGMMIGNVWAQYYTRIKGSILFHSVPYFSRNKSDLEYLEYDKLGTAASAGCIRLTVKDAKWIYNNCPAGTKVEFYTSTNPGPLGKPTAQKISEEKEVRGWDPTDPDTRNPWKTYNPDENNEETTVTKPTPTPTPTPTKKPTQNPTPTPTPTPEPTPDSETDPNPGTDPEPEPTPTPEATPTPDVTPEITPTPESTPTPEPTPETDLDEDDEIIGEEENT